MNLMNLMKKDKGETISNFAPIVVTTLVIAIIIIAFTNWMADINKKFDINQIERKYSLQMETTGYLTTTQYNNLKAELEAAGMTVELIETYGHNLNETEANNQMIEIGKANTNLKYGATIYLHCKGTVNFTEVHGEKGLSDGATTKTGFLAFDKTVTKLKIDDVKSTTLKN